MECILETNASTILEFFAGLRGSLSVAFEEGTSADWLSGLLKPHVARVVVCKQLQPDLILLDIGLPTLNGIEAARRIQLLSPTSKILFVSENRSSDIAEDALSAGAGGYVVESDAARELLPAIKAVLEGNRLSAPH